MKNKLTTLKSLLPALGLVAISTSLLIYFKLRKNKESLPLKKIWDSVDEASWESFPASDSPGW